MKTYMEIIKIQIPYHILFDNAKIRENSPQLKNPTQNWDGFLYFSKIKQSYLSSHLWERDALFWVVRDPYLTSDILELRSQHDQSRERFLHTHEGASQNVRYLTSMFE